MFRKLNLMKRPSKAFMLKLLPIMFWLTLMGIQLLIGTAPPNSPPPPGFT